jgi:hypothetical protein
MDAVALARHRAREAQAERLAHRGLGGRGRAAKRCVGAAASGGGAWYRVRVGGGAGRPGDGGAGARARARACIWCTGRRWVWVRAGGGGGRPWRRARRAPRRLPAAAGLGQGRRASRRAFASQSNGACEVTAAWARWGVEGGQMQCVQRPERRAPRRAQRRAPGRSIQKGGLECGRSVGSAVAVCRTPRRRPPGPRARRPPGTSGGAGRRRRGAGRACAPRAGRAGRAGRRRHQRAAYAANP